MSGKKSISKGEVKIGINLIWKPTFPFFVRLARQQGSFQPTFGKLSPQRQGCGALFHRETALLKGSHAPRDPGAALQSRNSSCCSLVPPAAGFKAPPPNSWEGPIKTKSLLSCT